MTKLHGIPALHNSKAESFYYITLFQSLPRKTTVPFLNFQMFIQVLMLSKYLLKEQLHFQNDQTHLKPAVQTIFLLNCLKETAVDSSLTLVYQASVKQGRVPNEWKKARVVPVYKKGGTITGLYITHYYAKHWNMHIISSHIYNHLQKYNILCQEQHGFRQHRSCETQLVMMVNDLAEALNRGAQVDAILLDFPYKRLLHKLIKSKIMALYC